MKQKAPWLTGQQTSLLPLYSPGSRQRMQTPQLHPPQKGCSEAGKVEEREGRE